MTDDGSHYYFLRQVELCIYTVSLDGIITDGMVMPLQRQIRCLLHC